MPRRRRIAERSRVLSLRRDICRFCHGVDDPILRGAIASGKRVWLTMAGWPAGRSFTGGRDRANSSNVCNFFAPARYSEDDPVRLQSLLY
jgi:hypothetical protein